MNFKLQGFFQNIQILCQKKSDDSQVDSFTYAAKATVHVLKILGGAAGMVAGPFVSQLIREVAQSSVSSPSQETTLLPTVMTTAMPPMKGNMVLMEAIMLAKMLGWMLGGEVLTHVFANAVATVINACRLKSIDEFNPLPLALGKLCSSDEKLMFLTHNLKMVLPMTLSVALLMYGIMPRLSQLEDSFTSNAASPVIDFSVAAGVMFLAHVVFYAAVYPLGDQAARVCKVSNIEEKPVKGDSPQPSYGATV